MANIETKREQFRRYLEQSGVIDALSKALIRLYDEPIKPEDAVKYVGKYMCEVNPEDEKENYDALKVELEEANQMINELKRELERQKTNAISSTSEIDATISDGLSALKDNDNCTSLLKKYLDEDMLQKLLPLQTSFKSTLLNCVQSGIQNPNEAIGIYAADPECYTTFGSLFSPVIQEYHRNDELKGDLKQPPIDWRDSESEAFDNLLIDGEFILCVRMKCVRNIDGYPFFPKMTEEHFEEILAKVKDVLGSFEGDFKGEIFPFENMDPGMEVQLRQKNILFTKDNLQLESAGAYKFWPTGRAIFYNPNQTLIVWINAEDHVSIITTAESGSLGAVYRQFTSAISLFDGRVQFCRDENYGFLTSCPKNIGTAMQISVRIKLSKLSKNRELLTEKLKEFNLSANLSNYHETEVIDEILEISNNINFGLTEFNIIKQLNDGVLELLEFEKDEEI